MEYTTDPPRSPYVCSCGSTITHHGHGQRESELERIEINNPGTLSNEKQG